MTVYTRSTELLIPLQPNPSCGELWMQKLRAPSVENPELKGSPFKAWSRPIYSHACFTNCQGFLADLYPPGPFTCIFSPNLSRVFPVLAVANTGSCMELQNKIGYAACGYRHLMQIPMLTACRI